MKTCTIPYTNVGASLLVFHSNTHLDLLFLIFLAVEIMHPMQEEQEKKEKRKNKQPCYFC